MEKFSILRIAGVLALNVVLYSASAMLTGLEWVGRATILANLASSENTTEKEVVSALLASPLLPGGLLLLAVVLTVYLCRRLLPSVRTASGNPKFSEKRHALKGELDSESIWEKVTWPHPADVPGRTKLFVSDGEVMQTVVIAPGNFQEISWNGVSLRMEYTSQYRRLPNGELYIELRIEATQGLLGSLTFSGGSEVSPMGDGLYRMPKGLPVRLVYELVTAPGSRCVYYHRMSPTSYSVILLYLDNINQQNGLLNLQILLASGSKPLGSIGNG